MKIRNMPRKKDPTKRHADKVRPNVYLTEAENIEVERYRINLDPPAEKSEFIRACIFHVMKNGIDPRDK